MNSLAEASRYLIPAFWIIWLAIWIGASFNVRRTRQREDWRTAIYNRAPVLLGAVMLAAPQLLPAALTRQLLGGADGPAIGTLLVAAGLALSVWARWHLGRNWSGIVTVKQGHTLVTTGPYRRVRHPIYTGLLVGLVGTALAIGAPYGFIATALILVGLVIKLHVEEERMRDTFRTDYEAYSRRTARLIPGVY
jgi:protein-S-isoprenylcysteine O-methyltransferase Ste14